MNSLVIMKDQQAVTTSLNVAETFERNHRDVLAAIDDLKEGVAENYADLFGMTLTFTRRTSKAIA